MRYCGSGKTNALLNLIQKQDNYNLIDKIYLYAKDLSEPKYQLLIKKRKDAGIKNSDNPIKMEVLEIIRLLLFHSKTHFYVVYISFQ